MASENPTLRPSGQAHLGDAAGHLSRSNILPNDTAACEALHMHELVTLIVDFFNAEVNASNKNKKALLPLTAVNRCFFNVTVDYLWCCMPSVAPFVRLLPPFNPAAKVRSQDLIDSLQGDPWKRFHVYSQSTRSIKLTADPDIQNYPPDWLFYLFQHPSRPTVPFPKLKQLTVSSIQGVNRLFAHQSLANLRTVWISDFLDGRDPQISRHPFILSLMTALASNSPSLWKLTLKPTLTSQMASMLPAMTGLTSLTVTLLAPVRIDDLLFLNGLPHLKTLSLATHGPAYNAVYPERKNHLIRTHPGQRQSRLTRLTLEGDPFFVFCAASFFCSPSLHSFVGVISSKLYPGQFPGLLLMPHILHLIIHSNPEVQEFWLEWNGCFIGDEMWDWHDERLTVPEDLGKALGKLRLLEKLVIKNIPIITTDFIVKLLDALPHLPSLHTLDLVPIAVDQDDILELPPMEKFVSIRERFPALRHLTLSMEDIPDIPSDVPQIVNPDHPLETLFIVPQFGELEEELAVSELIPLSRYLHWLFPNLKDITSYFEPKPSSRSKGQSRDDDDNVTLETWRNLDGLLKTYQQIRAQAAYDLQKNAQAPIGGGAVDMDQD